MKTKTYLIVTVGVLACAVSCSKKEDKDSQVSPAPPVSQKNASPESNPTVWLIPSDITTSAGSSNVDVHIQLNSGKIDKEMIEGMVSKISWKTYPEGDEIKFNYHWVPAQPYEIPKDTPKDQPIDNTTPTDVTGNPITPKNSETRTTFTLSPENKIEDRWYQIIYNDEGTDSVKNVPTVNPKISGKIVSRFNLGSSPTIQNIEICKKGKTNQKISIRFSEPVSYSTLKQGLHVASLVDGSACSFVDDIHSNDQTSVAEYMCNGLWGETIAAKIKQIGSIKSASSSVQFSMMNTNAKTQNEVFQTSSEIEVNFKASYKENEYCYLWTP